MANFLTVCKKELADHLGSKRYLVLFVLVLGLAAVTAYQGATSMQNSVTSSSNLSFMDMFSGSLTGGISFTYVMIYFGPIIGLALGFDAINKERSSGSLSVLLSQPIFRDAVINGKFLAGIAALSLMVTGTVGIMVGLAIPIIGFGPTLAETGRIFVFAILTILYLGFWLALSLLFSTAIKKTATAIIGTVVTWIFFTFILAIVATLIASAVVPVQTPQFFAPSISSTSSDQGGFISRPIDQTQTDLYIQSIQNRQNLQNIIQSISPSYLYTQAANILLTGSNYGSVIVFSSSGMIRPNTDVTSCWPQVTALAAAMIACFVAAYLLFLRREIRAGG
ncbi:MAG: ABC transporter permease [Candidatus Bathyarchaeota archaeon]|nr:ABC transporter permease [Candidatus Bathyarchaeota archaeon]